MVGGLFLIAKSTSEIHHKVEGDEQVTKVKKITAFSNAIVQIVLLDIIFSFDSILTAVGLTNEIKLMIIAVIVSIIVMMIFAKAISNFINKQPTLQVLALSFLILIGFMLIIEGLHYHVPKGYIYFAVFFSLIVEIINIKVRKK
jgi:predicted tellurium resistance membrane protein TerC